MKKFLIRVVVFVSILVALVAGINAVYVQKKREISSESKYLDVPYNIEICSFGSSHGNKGYNFEDYETEHVCFNFALNSQALVYDKIILENYVDHISPGATALITVSYTSLIGKPITEAEEFASQNRRYYTILPDDDILQYDSKTDFYMEYLPAAIDYEDTIRVLLGIAQDQRKIWQRKTTPSEAETDAKSAYDRHFVTNKLNEVGELIINEENIRSLYSMIDICEKNEITPVLVTIPCLSEYTNEIISDRPEIIDICYGIIQKVINDTNVKYYDYCMNEQFASRYDLFTNSDHLNKEGARLFTHALLQNIGLI